MCPGTLVTQPTSVFSHCSGCVRLYRAQYRVRLAIHCDDAMNVIATNIQGPELPFANRASVADAQFGDRR